MSLRESAKRLATNAVGIAVATGGLSGCGNGGSGGIGAVDPAPPTLQCNTLNMGQSLTATAARSGDTVVVKVRHALTLGFWQSAVATSAVGATIESVTPPTGRLADSIVVRLRPSSPATTVVTFVLTGRFIGFANDSCEFTRTFTITISPNGIGVAQVDPSELPLPARQRASVIAVAREGETITLEAQSTFAGAQRAEWEVTGGLLDANSGPRVRWTLPATPGFYQAELTLDFGADGMAFDVLMLEVS